MLHQNLETRSFITFKKQELFDQLLSSIEGRFDPQLGSQPLPLWEWAEKTPIILDGRPFSFQRHEYLRVPYQDNHPYQVDMKAAQMGLTSKAALKMVYGARFGNYRGILYLLAHRTGKLPPTPRGSYLFP